MKNKYSLPALWRLAPEDTRVSTWDADLVMMDVSYYVSREIHLKPRQNNSLLPLGSPWRGE